MCIDGLSCTVVEIRNLEDFGPCMTLTFWTHNTCRPTVYLSVSEIWNLKDFGVMTLTLAFWGYVTSSVT